MSTTHWMGLEIKSTLSQEHLEAAVEYLEGDKKFKFNRWCAEEIVKESKRRIDDFNSKVDKSKES